jgi:hypothetical protein
LCFFKSSYILFITPTTEDRIEMEKATIKSPDKEVARQAAAILGSIRTEKKAKAAAANGFKQGNKHGGQKPKLLSEIPCSCSVGDALTGHRWDCGRGQAIIRRGKQGRDIQTGEKQN